jgi:hypothetical protein
MEDAQRYQDSTGHPSSLIIKLLWPLKERAWFSMALVFFEWNVMVVPSGGFVLTGARDRHVKFGSCQWTPRLGVEQSSTYSSYQSPSSTTSLLHTVYQQKNNSCTSSDSLCCECKLTLSDKECERLSSSGSTQGRKQARTVGFSDQPLTHRYL